MLLNTSLKVNMGFSLTEVQTSVNSYRAVRCCFHGSVSYYYSSHEERQIMKGWDGGAARQETNF